LPRFPHLIENENHSQYVKRASVAFGTGNVQFGPFFVQLVGPGLPRAW